MCLSRATLFLSFSFFLFCTIRDDPCHSAQDRNHCRLFRFGNWAVISILLSTFSSYTKFECHAFLFFTTIYQSMKLFMLYENWSLWLWWSISQSINFMYIYVLFYLFNLYVLNINIHESQVTLWHTRETSDIIRTTFYICLNRPCHDATPWVHHSLLHFPMALSAEPTRCWRIGSTEVGRARNSPSRFIYGPPSDKNLIAY